MKAQWKEAAGIVLMLILPLAPAGAAEPASSTQSLDAAAREEALREDQRLREQQQMQDQRDAQRQRFETRQQDLHNHIRRRSDDMIRDMNRKP
ncbi:hypothetical protein MWU49_11145 [Alcanivorax sp. S6407]|uniref:hypothetical protein n=1 Tax=Alcanivorax sp. S6407 TaxID=2926424 RepID=UPI001FF39CB5|nr:hypothetical protein [Alcanivorax sp. S6407]MCK0154259.1 hypothetical protein [Alcanivorax sp. S6407]